MCVILICPPKQRPDLNVLKACAEQNPHGAGVAWRSGSRVKWKKDLSAKQVKALIDSVGGEVVIHFRWASIGGVNPALCHPFPVAHDSSVALKGKARRVLFHNGTWSSYRDALDQLTDEAELQALGAMSDTRAAAVVVSHLGPEQLRTMPGRWVVFDAKKTRVFGEWDEFRGFKVSNLAFVRRLCTDEELSRKPVNRTLGYDGIDEKIKRLKADDEPPATGAGVIAARHDLLKVAKKYHVSDEQIVRESRKLFGMHPSNLNQLQVKTLIGAIQQRELNLRVMPTTQPSLALCE